MNQAQLLFTFWASYTATRHDMTCDQLIIALAPIGAGIFLCILHNAVKIARVSRDIQWMKTLLDLHFNNPGEDKH